MLVQTDKLARMIESKQDKLRGLQRLTERESIGSIPTQADCLSERKPNTALPDKRFNAILSADNESVWSRVKIRNESSTKGLDLAAKRKSMQKEQRLRNSEQPLQLDGTKE